MNVTHGSSAGGIALAGGQYLSFFMSFWKSLAFLSNLFHVFLSWWPCETQEFCYILSLDMIFLLVEPT